MGFPNTSGEMEKDCILPKNRRQVKLMVWGCFWGSQRGPLVPLMPANGSTYHSLLVSTEICCAVDSFLSSRAFEHPSAVIIYFNKTMLAYTLQSLCSPSLKDMTSFSSPIHLTPLTSIQLSTRGFSSNDKHTSITLGLATTLVALRK